MKKPASLFLGALSCLLVSCGNVEKQAEAKLLAARQAYEAGRFSEAKSLIDSIKILYPKAFDTRRAGLYLMQDVELAEQNKSLVYLDSLLQVEEQKLPALREGLVFEKDTAYQQIGHYLAPSQVIERNLHRSYLRFQTDENGAMSLTSIYCGRENIHHTAVKVSAPDKTFAQTPDSKDSYETSDLVEKIEKADYKMGEDGGVISFVCLNKDKDIRVEYIGDRTYVTRLTPADRQAAAKVYALSQVLSSITQIKQQKDETNLKIRFIQENIKKRKSAE